MGIRVVSITLVVISSMLSIRAAIAAQINQYTIYQNSYLKNHKKYKQYTTRNCGGPCYTTDECSADLICVNPRYPGDPDEGTHICQRPVGSSEHIKQFVDDSTYELHAY
jgi:hypothetical protein